MGVEKGDAAAQAAFFMHPDPVIYVLHASDLTMQANYESHREMTDEEFLEVIVGEDWIVQRVPSGELKFALYINTHHQLLPDSAPFSLA